MKSKLFILASAIFALAWIEAGFDLVRLFAPTTWSLRQIVQLDQPRGVNATDQTALDPKLLWKCKNQPVAITQSRPERRILFLGDGVTSGLGVPFEKSFPVLVGDALNADIVVDACPGYSTFQGKALLARDLQHYDPDIVVIWYGINDGAWLEGKADADQARLLGDRKAYSVKMWESWLQTSWAEATNDIRRVPAEDYTRNLTEMVALCRSRSAHPVVVTGSAREGSTSPHDEATLSAVAQVVDLREVLNDREMMLDGVHPNAKGHAKVATIFEKRLGSASAQAPTHTSPAATLPMSHPTDVNCSAWGASCGTKP